MEFRNYQESDAIEILKWIKTERDFRLWSADRYEKFPATPEDINENYKICKNNGLFCPMTLVDDNKIIGHLILRKSNKGEHAIRLGFIIVDDSMRSKGYGKKIINEAITYAREKLNANEINLGVFANNESAIRCYKAVGFEEVGLEKNAYMFQDENWDCIEMRLRDVL